MLELIKTRRLDLVPAHPDHSDALFIISSDAAITTYLAWEPHKSRPETAAVLEALADANENGAGAHWIIFHDDAVVGVTSLIDIRRKHRTWTVNRAELAFWIGSAYQGNGYATEAAAAACEYGLKAMGLHKIVMAHAGDNAASGRVAAKLNFEAIGRERDAFFKAGKWHSLHWYELFAEAQAASNSTA